MTNTKKNKKKGQLLLSIETKSVQNGPFSLLELWEEGLDTVQIHPIKVVPGKVCEAIGCVGAISEILETGLVVGLHQEHVVVGTHQEVEAKDVEPVPRFRIGPSAGSLDDRAQTLANIGQVLEDLRASLG